MTVPAQGPSPVGGGPAVSLTAHELRVLGLVANGHTQEDIARQLFTTPKGITPTVNRAIRKLGATNAPHAVLLACRAGLLDGKPRRHGDHAGFAAHQYRGEEPCEACWEGERAYRRDRKAARKAAKVDAA
ncbi:helix-turn-helix transcriptional regulator [Streptomyces sp. sk2.1]|uniref:helix-turn-helix domain-containing protein n=1 Tax=Streptomyces sp. sk2.1 TaxID=2478959 RepID=UPI0011E844CB|nr:helix-turn-helix transcriptional regulator [Streptomyces sp. sk2.1]TXS58822.1 LuxR family transcriptional regulator [Streptomyces sp. sk2.1]